MHAYDRDNAAKLVPLLESIFSEVADRRRAIRDMERTLASMKRAGAPSAEIGHVTAKLAIHRRELRHTAKEFERLGCVVDEHNPNRVIIPGSNGALEGGFHWQAGETEVVEQASDHCIVACMQVQPDAGAPPTGKTARIEYTVFGAAEPHHSRRPVEGLPIVLDAPAGLTEPPHHLVSHRESQQTCVRQNC